MYVCGQAEWDANGARHVIYNVQATETVRAAHAEQRPQAEPLNLRMARQEDDMCCGQRVERGLPGHLLCALTHGTLSRITYSSQSEASSARVSRKGISATHATSDHHSGEVRNHEKQSCYGGIAQSTSTSGHCLHTEC
jgi:hypothetical protein